jgi:hypothetical protein
MALLPSSTSWSQRQQHPTLVDKAVGGSAPQLKSHHDQDERQTWSRTIQGLYPDDRHAMLPYKIERSSEQKIKK